MGNCSMFGDKYGRWSHEEGGENYRSFLLRCWQEEEPVKSPDRVWRFTLVQMNGRQKKKGFASLDELVAYLRAELISDATSSPGNDALNFDPSRD